MTNLAIGNSLLTAGHTVAPRRRFKKGALPGRGFDAGRPNRCVMNLLRLIAEDPNALVFFPPGSYTRAGRCRVVAGGVRSPLGDKNKPYRLRSHQSRFNFMFLARADVDRVTDGGIETTVEKRAKHIIRDGELCVDALLLTMSENTFRLIVEAGLLPDQPYVAGYAYLVPLTDVPLSSPAFANATVQGLIDIMQEEIDLADDEAALKRRRLEVGRPAKGKAAKALLPVKRRTLPAKEAYRAACCEYVLADGAPSRTFDCSRLTAVEVDDWLHRVRSRLIHVRLRKRIVVFSMECIGSTLISWSAPRIPRRTANPRTQQLASWQGRTLKRRTWSQEFKR